jgi:acyl-CoA thioester hydrolase
VPGRANSDRFIVGRSAFAAAVALAGRGRRGVDHGEATSLGHEVERSRTAAAAPFVVVNRRAVSLQLPAIDPLRSTTATELRVRFCETDLMGVVHHASYLVYFEVGRVDWLRKRGITYADWTARGVQVPVVDAQVQYCTSSRFDELLSVETTLTKLRTVSLDYRYRVLRGATLIAEGSTRLACIDQHHKLLRIPEEIRHALLSGEVA